MENQTEPTFTMEVSYLAKMPDNTGGWKDEIVTKTATFRELDRRDRSQHKLHSLIIAVFQNFKLIDNPGGDPTMKIDSDGIYDLAVRSVNTLYVETLAFPDSDKKEFMLDGLSIIQLGYKLLSDKLFPFFLSSNQTSKSKMQDQTEPSMN